jgi:diguanylate cyclase (GGDEF)-like protein
MFWRKKKSRKESSEATQQPERDASAAEADTQAEPDAAAVVKKLEDELDRCLDALASLVRCYGEQAFDCNHATAEELKESCEKWARHMLVGTPAIPAHELIETSESNEPNEPNEPNESDEPSEGDESDEPTEARPQSPVPRDYRNLILTGRDQRRLESNYVIQSLGDFHQAVWSFVQALRRAITLDRIADNTTSSHLRRLNDAVESNSPTRIRREAEQCVQVVGTLINERDARQQGHIEILGQRLQALRGELEVVREQTERDALTGLFNRAAFDEQIERISDLDFLVNQGAYLFMMDVDHFKWVNDTHGHACGDLTLKGIAEAIRKCFDRSEGFVARFGGEEFAALIRAPSVEVAEGIAEKVLYAVRDLIIRYDEDQLRVSISIGLANLRPSEEAESWLKRADAALYRAKEAGRDRLAKDIWEAAD